MVADRPQRLQAASALAAFLNAPAWQQVVAAGGYRSGQQIILALETDTFADLRPRVERCEPPVHVAVYRPSALAAPRLHFLVLEPASPGFDPLGDVVDPESTVGAFCTRQDRSAPARWQPHLVLRELAGV